MMGRTKHTYALLLLCSLAVSAHQDGPVFTSPTDENSLLMSPARNDTNTDLHLNATTTTQLRKHPETPGQDDNASSVPAASLTEMNDEFAREGFLVFKQVRKRRRKHHSSLGNSSRPAHSKGALAKLTFLSKEGGKDAGPRDEAALGPNERNEGVAQMVQQQEQNSFKPPDPGTTPENSSDDIIDPQSLPPDYTFSEPALEALDFPDSTIQSKQKAALKEKLAKSSTASHTSAEKTPAASTKERVDPESVPLDYTFAEASMAALDFPDGSEQTNQNSASSATSPPFSPLLPLPTTTMPSSSLPSSLASSTLSWKPRVAHHQYNQSPRHVEENDELNVPNEATTAVTLQKQQMSSSWEASDENYDDALEVHEESEEYYDETTNEPRHRYRRAAFTETTVSGDTTVGPDTTTPPFTTCVPDGVGLGIGGRCGMGNRTCGFCSTPSSACGKNPFGPEGAKERICLCVFGTLGVDDMNGVASCAKPSSQLFDVDAIPETLLLSGGSGGGEPVLNITLFTTSKARFTKTVQIFPKDSFLGIDDSKSNDSLLILYLTKSPSNANARHDFTISATVNYMDDDITLNDVIYLTVNTSHVFQPTPPVTTAFVVDGSRKGTVVFDVLSVLGNVDGLTLTLDTDITKKPFKLRNYLVVCTHDIFLRDFATRDHIGMTVTVHIKSSGQIVLDLRVAILVNNFQRSVLENENYSFRVANFANLRKAFEVTLKTEGTARDFFNLSASGDYVRLTQLPDYETASQRKFSFDLEIKARKVFNIPLNRGRNSEEAPSTEIRVDVEVQDVDDTAPKPKQTAYNFQIPQGADTATIIGFVEFTDSDTSLDQLVYTIEDGKNSYKHLFRQIDPANRALILTQKLPRSYANTTMEFNVTASDKSSVSEPVTVFVQVYKIITDTETVLNAPAKNVTLFEELDAGTFVISLALPNYTDYKLQSPSSFFAINKTSGYVVTSEVIDREKLVDNPLTISVLAYPVDELCIFKIVGNATIHIQDKNDNAPQFVRGNVYNAQNDVYSVAILEHSDVNFHVTTVTATDADIGTNADLTFSLSGPDSGLFAINSTTGLVTVKDSQGLDRETNATRHVTINVTDGRYQISTKLMVTLTDINDNDPAFAKSRYSLTVQENGDPGMDNITLTASDLDAGNNSAIRFQLWKGGLGYFTINSSTGVVSTTKSLDREQTDSFSLIVLAFDQGSPPRSASVTVSVTVADLNDVTPHFEFLEYSKKLDEGTACSTTAIIRLSAQDEDTGLGGEVVYTMDSDLLWVNSTTGQIFCNGSLDFEQQKEFASVVTVTDLGTPALYSTATLHLTLNDVNDNSPRFLQQGSGYIFEVHRDDRFVGVVYAEDRDSGANGNVTYSLTSLTPTGQGLLDITNQGLLFLVNASANTPIGQYELSVTATDGGTPSLESSVKVTVHVLAERPSILFTKSELNFALVENTNYSLSAIGQVESAVGSVNFSLKEVFPKDIPSFRVDEDTGHIFCDNAVDRELDSSVGPESNVTYTLFIRGQSSSGTTSFAAVRIHVLDVNDNTPNFKLTSNVTKVREGLTNGTIVANFSATDPDYGVNGTVVFSANDSAAPFKINPTNGSISVSGVLDRETVSKYILIITVSDGGPTPRSASVTWTAILTDINDNAPEFNKTITSFPVDENSVVAHLVGRVHATDKDLPLNARISYSVSNPDDCPCDVVTSYSGGELTVKSNWTLDYDHNSTRMYTCTIKAENINTTVVQSSEMNVTILVNDVNDNAPVFPSTTLNVTVSRDAEVDDIVKNLTATDADSGQNSALTYGLNTSGSQNIASFSIDPLTGTIQVARSLRDVAVEMLTLNVTVTDHGSPPLADFLLIYVNITDNNTLPQFRKEGYSFNVTEGVYPTNMAPVVTVSAIDFEAGSEVQCQCSYNIAKSKSGSEVQFDKHFHVNSESGEITMIQRVDREKTGDVILGYVVVVDNGIPPKSATATLNVTVLDTNDNGPKFSKKDFAITVNQSMCTSVFYTLTATDKDLPPHDQFEYSIRQSDVLNGSNFVDVNKKSGQLSFLNPSKLCSQETSIQFKVAVTEIVNNNRTDKDDEIIIMVNIILNSTNNAPVFTRSTFQAVLPYSSARGTSLKVPNFSATDADDDTLTFGLQSGNRRDLFVINNRTGALTLQYPLDETIPSVLNLTITVTDREDVGPKFAETGTATVIVSIRDPTVQTCLSSGEASDLKSRAEQFNLYRGLFIALVILLIIAIIVAVIVTYKWRILKMEGSESEVGSTQTLHPMFRPTVPVGTSDGRSNTRLGDPTGLPPKPPRRKGPSADTGQSATSHQPTDSGMDSAGYLAPSVSADRPSDQNISWPWQDPTPHRIPRIELTSAGVPMVDPTPHWRPLAAATPHRLSPRRGEHDYLSLIPATPEMARPRGQSDTYRHLVPETPDPYLHPVPETPDPYLHPIPESLDGSRLQPAPEAPESRRASYLHLLGEPEAGETGQPDPYNRPATSRPQTGSYGYRSLRPAASALGDPSDPSDSESYLHPTAGLDDLDLPPPAPHSSYVFMPSPGPPSRDPAVYTSGLSRSLGLGGEEVPFSANIPARLTSSAQGQGVTGFNC